MTTEIAVRGGISQPSTVTPAGIDFTTEQIDTIKKTIARGASDTELDLFLAICRRTGLDPFLKQIHLIPRRSKTDRGDWITAYQPLVGIDGMRLTAERTGKYGGQEPTLYLDGETGAWEEIWHGNGHPFAAKATIYRKDWAKPMVAIARWDPYVQTNNTGGPNATWAKMPDVMLGKCAESLAFRRAFPAEMSQLAVSLGGSDSDTTALEIEASDSGYRLEDSPRTEGQSFVDDQAAMTAGARHESGPIDADFSHIDPEDVPFDPEPEGEPEAPAPATPAQVKAIAENGKRLMLTAPQILYAANEEFDSNLESIEALSEAQATAFIERQSGLLKAKGKVAVTA